MNVTDAGAEGVRGGSEGAREREEKGDCEF